MRRFGVLVGLPRSGSTLLANILNQNERVFVTSSSPLPYAVAAAASSFSTSPEMKSELAFDRVKAEKRVSQAVRGIVDGWHSSAGDVLVIDKGRTWGGMIPILEALESNAPVICCVRDPRMVLASIEKQHSRCAILDDAPNLLERTVVARLEQLFAPNGMIGSSVAAVEDLLRRRPKSLSFVQYEMLVKHPKMTLERVYSEIGEEPFEHDFEAIEKSTWECDALWLHKFPHEGTGKVEESEESWEGHLAPDIAASVMMRYQIYNQTFGYR